MMSNAAHSLRVMREDGSFSAPCRLSWEGGVFALGGDAQPSDADGSGLWVIPGIVDAHVHASWHAFDAAERSALDPEQLNTATVTSLRRTLEAGVTSIRDAGGLTAAALQTMPEGARPRAQLSVSMIDRAVADAAGGVGAAVEEALAAGARWIKLMATAGIAAPSSAGLEPVFSRAEQREAVRRAARVGAGVMVHAWGGAAIDDAVDAGAMSIEHGIYMTSAQAAAAAQYGMTFVPTLRIYKLVQRMIAEGALPPGLRSRANDVVSAHPIAVRRAFDAGLAIALGTDYGTAEQHGTNRNEFDALLAAGLSVEEALVAATRSGAALLARVAVDPSVVSDGRIAEGSLADAVILRDDPRKAGALSHPDAVVSVVLAGRPIEIG